MKRWKVILAIAVIFSGGFVAGSALSKKMRLFAPSEAVSAEEPPFLPWEMREAYLRRLNKELHLTPEQYQAISQDLNEGQQRIKILFELIGPEMREEMRQARDSIRAVLTPEQQELYDDYRKRKRSKSKGDKDGPGGLGSACDVPGPFCADLWRTETREGSAECKAERRAL